MKNFKIVFVISLLFVGFSFAAALQPSEASLGHLNKDRSLTYDVYFGNDLQSSHVVKNVKLTRTVKIDGEIFLGIEPIGSSLNEAEGFIRLKTISALLPHQEIPVAQAP